MDLTADNLSLTPKSSCGCNEHDAPVPELDARAIPHAIRHATIFGALESLAVGQQMKLIAPHEPLPLLAQLADRNPGAFEHTSSERGPAEWEVLFTRVA